MAVLVSRIRRHACTYMNIRFCIPPCADSQTHKHIHVCIYIYIFTHMYMRIYVYSCKHRYMHRCISVLYGYI